LFFGALSDTDELVKTLH